ncbi:MAG: OsmC family protein [Tatlockia sp.]|nr:OsmC family protein [Tatlockia sp.]
MKLERTGKAEWKGGLKDGKGTVSTESAVLNHAPYSFATRFENGPGTNPEELIAAAHAGCFTMAFSAQLEQAGFKAESIETTAALSLEKSADGFSIPSIHLQMTARIPNASEDDFNKAAQAAKENCPVSKLMKATITMDARLEKN